MTAPSPERPDRPAFRVPRRIVTGHDMSGASVVVSDGQLLIRTHEALWCVGE